MQYKMTRDRFARFVRATFKAEMTKGDIIQTFGTAVYVNGLLMSTKALSAKLGIDVRDIVFIDHEQSNIDLWKNMLKGGI